MRAALEALPAELSGVADRVSVVLPWGSLLRAVARPELALLSAIRGLCQPDAETAVVLAIDPVRDRAELERLGLELRAPVDWRARLSGLYAAAGFDSSGVRVLGHEGLLAWPSTWARRLAYGERRAVVEIRARAC